MQETIIVNILGGPGIGKSTCALQVVAEIKKQGYQAEYVQEVAKELVYAGDMEHLNGSLENQAYILSKQKERLDLLVGQVDFVITDSPLPLNLIYLKEHNEYYETEVLREFNTYKNINIVLGRNLAVEYQNEGRIHTLEESLVKDKEIVELLEKNSLPYRNFERSDISGIIEYITSEEQQRDNSSKLTLSSEEIEGIAKKIQQNANETNHFKEQLNYLERQIESNNVIALNNKKANDVLRSIGKSYPKENSLISFDNSIAYSLNNVKYPDNRLRSISSEINTEPKRIIRNEDNQVLRKEKDIIKAIKNKLDYEDRNFSKQLDRFIRGTLPSSKLIDVCDTPNILKIVGSTAPKVILKQSDLKNAIGKKDSRNHSEIHNISTSVLRKIPKEIRNPIMVLQGRKNNTDSVVLVTELQSEEKKNIILPISLNRNNGKINKLITIYDKNDIIQYLNIHKNEILAINIKKADNLFSSKGLQLSELLSDTVIRNTANASFGDKGLQSPKSISDTIIYYDDSIAYSLKNVKYPEEKELINDEKLTLSKNEVAKFTRTIEQYNTSDNEFLKQVDRFVNGEMKNYETIPICQTPNIFSLIGSNSKEIIITQSALKNSMFPINEKTSKHSQGHNISIEQIKKLPKALREPVLIINGQHDKTIVLLTDIQGENSNLIVPVAININGINGTVNKVASIYEKKHLDNYLTKHEKEIIAVNIEKADKLYRDIGCQLPKLDTVICFDNSIAYSLKNVKYPEEKSPAPSCERIVIDTETTGLSPFGGDELLQVSIVNTEGTVLYNEYVKPTAHEAWEAAMAVNNITPEMVAGAKTIEEQLSEISKITLNAKEIIGYNTYFDINFLSVAGVEFSDTVKVTDVKADFTERHGVWDKYKGDFKWIKLTECAEHYGYDWNSNEGQAHNSVSDCFATLHCYNEFRKEIEREREEQQARKAQRAEKYAMTLQNDKVRIYVDMDGTLARFHDEVKYLERMWEEGFFEQLKPFQEMVDGIKLLKQQNPNAEVFILSAAIEGEPPYCQRQKHEWLDRYLPEIDKEHRIFTKIGTPKADYIKGGVKMTDILIDDYNKGLEEWQRFGGTAVKCHNNINHKGLIGKLWDGKIIHNFEAPEKICKDIVQIANSLPGTSGQGEALKRTASPVRHKEQEQSHRKR